MDQEKLSELTVARLHRERLAVMVEDQAVRVQRLREQGVRNDNSLRLLELLRESLQLLDDFIERRLTDRLDKRG